MVQVFGRGVEVEEGMATWVGDGEEGEGRPYGRVWGSGSGKTGGTAIFGRVMIIANLIAELLGFAMCAGQLLTELEGSLHFTSRFT